MTRWLPVWLPARLSRSKKGSGMISETLAELHELHVELWGFEPQTSCMPCKRSTN
jgi:hypothetical protein